MKAGPLVRDLYYLYQTAKVAEATSKGFLTFSYYAKGREYRFDKASEIKTFISKIVKTVKEAK